MGSLGTYLIYVIPPLILGLAAQAWLKSTFSKNVKIRVASGLTGAQVARHILDQNGLSEVPVEQSPGGALSDHYDPGSRVVRLSPDVYGTVSVAGTAVAAHEVGHAIQHARSFAPLAFRTALWKPVQFASSAWTFLLFGGLIFQATGLIELGIAVYAIVILFQLVTLPVEFDASRRAGQQLRQLNLVSGSEGAAVRTTLTAAAMTYVVGALASLAMLAYYLTLVRNN